LSIRSEWNLNTVAERFITSLTAADLILSYNHCPFSYAIDSSCMFGVVFEVFLVVDNVARNELICDYYY